MNQIEFLPERIRQQRRRHLRLARQAYLLVAVLAGLAGLTYLRQGGVASARAELAGLNGRLADLQLQVAEIPPLERQMSDLLIKKRIDEELGSQIDSTAVLAELCRLLPRNVSLISLDFRTVTVNLPTPRAGGKAPPPAKRFRLVLTGLAPTDVDVANFIGQLSASPLLEDVNMGYSKPVTYRQRNAREFQAGCYLVR